MKYVDRTKLFKKYHDKWVAFGAGDRVVASGSNPNSVLIQAQRKGYDNPVITKVPNPKFDYLLI